MGVKISYTDKISRYPEILNRYLPTSLCEEINSAFLWGEKIEEIRIRAGRSTSLTLRDRNLSLQHIMSPTAVGEMIASMCGHSLYAYSEMINQGYITLEGGIRVGICGRASVKEDKIIGVYDISSVNIRIPSEVRGVGGSICELLRSMKGCRGVLVYSPPGVGKTTLLRSVAYSMANGTDAKRVVVIDTRGEIGCFEGMRGGNIDVLVGYPKGIGIDIAARTMNAQLMVCDEIGEEREVAAILYAQNSGVPLLASAHGENIKGLLSRRGIAKLHRAGVFGAYARIERKGRVGDYSYEITTAEAADDILQNNRSRDTLA